MKWIDKRSSPAFFEQWKRDFEAEHGRNPEYRDLVGDPKHQLALHLLKEQGYLCCYCMAKIDFGSYHLEHFIPRAAARYHPEQYPNQDIELGYENLFLSCEGEHFAGDHCGRYKADTDADQLLSPADPAVDHSFTYSLDGKIEGKDQKAENMIQAANLDSFALRRHRASAICISGFFDDDFPENKDALIRLYQSKDEDGAFQPFCMAIVYVMEHC